MMTDFNEIMSQAKQMQEQFKKAQQDLAKTTVLGESGAGLVKIKINGRHDVLDV
ncbi:MAG TPA: nucleoid-associated protein, YbaB/EbfC family, partial [Gammaproteobacteria bacterium]|nr:nucleoid-associated protein, YbaB/EbfC family [Gammaproteobacteria bacterium]